MRRSGTGTEREITVESTEKVAKDFPTKLGAGFASARRCTHDKFVGRSSLEGRRKRGLLLRTFSGFQQYRDCSARRRREATLSLEGGS